MKLIYIMAVLFFFNISKGFSQFGAISYQVLNRNCDNFQTEGISPLISNKSWKMTQMYGNQVPFSDSIAKSYMFLFKADSLHTADTLFIIQRIGTQFAGSQFKYSINQASSTITLNQFETNVPQKQFKVTCLTPGHLAFEFDETDNLNPAKTVKMEYRFLVDYTMTPP